MSKINFACPSCGSKYSVPASAAGKQAKCKSCGKAIAVPAVSADAMPIADNKPSTGQKMDMSSMYDEASAKAKSAEPTVQPPGFNFEGSAFTHTKRKSPGISPAILIGGAGGVVVLLLIVVLVVVLSGGGNDTPDDETIVETPTNRPTRNRGTTRDPSSTTDENPDENPDVNVEPDTPFGATALTPPAESTELVDWTLDTDAIPEDAVHAVSYRGISVLFPNRWEVLNPVEIAAQGLETTDSAALSAFRDDDLASITFTTYRVGNAPLDGWPAIYEVEEMLHGMFADATGNEEFGTLAERSILGVHPLKPNGFFIHEDALKSITYGSLFGGYPFARLEISGKNDYAFEYRVMYIGYLGDVLVTATIDVPKNERSALESLESIVRTATLLDRTQAHSDAQGDTAYLTWLEEAGASLRFADSTPPMAGLEQELWAGLGDDSVFDNTGMALGAVSPSHQHYAIIAPENLQQTAISSVAVRWFPDAETGLWMQLLVSELTARQAHMDSPIIAPSQADPPTHALIQGNMIALPEGCDYSTLDADGLLLHRILLPAVSFSPMQKVYYLAIDGQREITISGQFDKTRPQDLVLLDEAATSLHIFELKDSTTASSSTEQDEEQVEEENESQPETTPDPGDLEDPGGRPNPRTNPEEQPRREVPGIRPGRGQPRRPIPERPGG